VFFKRVDKQLKIQINLIHRHVTDTRQEQYESNGSCLLQQKQMPKVILKKM